MTFGDRRSTWDEDGRLRPEIDHDGRRRLRVPVFRLQSRAIPLDQRQDSGYDRFKRNLVVLDYMAGTTALVCIAVLSIWLISQVLPMRLGVQSATADVAYAAPYDLLALPVPATPVNLRELQSKLERLGFNPGAVDGIAGGRTLDALNRYRESRNLARASKIDNAATAGLLD